MLSRGFDTETADGYVLLLADSAGHICEPSHPTAESATEELLDWLYAYHSPDGPNVWWNLGFDIAAILKPAVVAHGKELRTAHYRQVKIQRRLRMLDAAALVGDWTQDETKEHASLARELREVDSVERLTIGGWKVQLIGDKGFSLRPLRASRRQKTKWWYDASAQYRTSFGGAALGPTAQKYLGEGKSAEEEGIDVTKMRLPHYYAAHRDAIVRYCIRDAALTARLMDRAAIAYGELGIPFPDRPFSRGSVSKAWMAEKAILMQSQKRYVTVLSRGPERGAWSQAFRGGVFLARMVGRVDRPYAHDIVSAYPAAMVSYPSLEDAIIVGPRDWRFASSFFKFYLVRLNGSVPWVATKEYDAEVTGGKRLAYGYDSTPRTVWLAAPDLWALDHTETPYVILKAHGIYCPSEDRPFEFLRSAFVSKSEVKRKFGGDSVEYQALKIAMNGVYGATAQRYPREGKLTNLIYAAYTTATCRQQLWQRFFAVEASGGRVAMLATDGLIVEGKVELPCGLDLGEWDVSSCEEPVVIYGSGIYVVGDHLKKRGLPTLTTDDLRTASTDTLTVRFERPSKLRSSLIRSEPEAIGVWGAITRTLDPATSARASMQVPADYGRPALKEYWGRSWWGRWLGES